MYLFYDEAVQVGLKVYHTLEYADSCRSAFRIASREFEEYMEDIGLPYSLILLNSGLITIKNTGITTNSKVQEKR